MRIRKRCAGLHGRSGRSRFSSWRRARSCEAAQRALAFCRQVSGDRCGDPAWCARACTGPRRTRSFSTGVRVDLSRPFARLSAVWLMPGFSPISVERGEAAGAGLHDGGLAREGLECGGLRHAQVEADPAGERAEVHRLGISARHAAVRCSVHRSARRSLAWCAAPQWRSPHGNRAFARLIG